MAEDFLDYLQNDVGDPQIGIGDTYPYDPGTGGAPYYPGILDCPAVSLSHVEANHLPPYIVARYIERFE